MLYHPYKYKRNKKNYPYNPVRMQENEQDHPIRMQEKRARPPHTDAREKKTNGPPTRTLKIYAIPSTRIPRGT